MVCHLIQFGCKITIEGPNRSTELLKLFFKSPNLLSWIFQKYRKICIFNKSVSFKTKLEEKFYLNFALQNKNKEAKWSIFFCL